MGNTISKLGCNVFGYFYPIYCTLTALKNNEDEKTKEWARNWLVLSCFFLSERLVEPLLQVLPLYAEVKLVLILWLTIPQFRGAEIVYKEYLLPFFSMHENSLDRLVSDIRIGFIKVIHFTTSQVLKFLKNQGIDVPVEEGQIKEEEVSTEDLETSRGEVTDSSN
ncbi:HVA22 family protein [Galdieria sulphuraria]|uniref:HVA22 family protein n=1 Tax=Galdieria sulphuraria TaxID=130081 RepID=M2XUQ4_GALSU|nr:HVA22 family protein [Galdieria sulphuraria]EME27149.1 HVA22 family protein [Galdieria sulphuraria]|eukprot:XP_005703669.1 HVA22 family protein [Galdieria sulphuraria]